MENLDEVQVKDTEMKLRIQTFDKVYHLVVPIDDTVLGLKNIINTVSLHKVETQHSS